VTASISEFGKTKILEVGGSEDTVGETTTSKDESHNQLDNQDFKDPELSCSTRKVRDGGSTSASFDGKRDPSNISNKQSLKNHLRVPDYVDELKYSSFNGHLNLEDNSLSSGVKRRQESSETDVKKKSKLHSFKTRLKLQMKTQFCFQLMVQS